MASALTDRRSTPAGATPATSVPERVALSPGARPELPPEEVRPEGADQLDRPVAPELLADLDHPNLVLSAGYVGPDRRAGGVLARIRRATFSQRRSLLSLEFAVVAVAVAVVASLLLTGPGTRLSSRPSAPKTPGPARVAPRSLALALAPVATTAPTTIPTAPVATAPPNTTPAPAAASAPPVTTPAPAQLGAEALTLVRYPWQQIPGYSIQFLPIADAPSPTFYGNTTFTWGQTGGTSVLYVYPGETVERLAGITAFEIAHEVDAAAVEPGGGETQIENVLNYHPSSWSPNCDCAEQSFLSGWYAAAFSNYWSPGVGNWSQLPVAPPSGATLGEVAAWLNPTIP